MFCHNDYHDDDDDDTDDDDTDDDDDGALVLPCVPNSHSHVQPPSPLLLPDHHNEIIRIMIMMNDTMILLKTVINDSDG